VVPWSIDDGGEHMSIVMKMTMQQWQQKSWGGRWRQHDDDRLLWLHFWLLLNRDWRS